MPRGQGGLAVIEGDGGLLEARGVGKTFQMKISNLSLAIVDTIFQRKDSMRVDQENSLYRQGLHYEDYLHQLDRMRGDNPAAGHDPLEGL